MTQILILADSLSGTGHQRRAEMLGGALIRRGYGVTYLSHALYDEGLRQSDLFRYVEWPSYAGALDNSHALLAVKMERMRRIVRLRGQAGPFAALICEHFPIGKLYLDEEIALLCKLFKAEKTQLLCVYRDIIDDGDLAQADRAVERLNRAFDALLVLADGDLRPLPAAFVARVQVPLIYLGYLDPHERHTILVFGGGGKFNDAFYQRTLDVLHKLAERFAIQGRFYTGSLMSDSALAALSVRAGTAIQVHRSTPDLYAELERAAITISTLGYNTFVDLLHFNNANIIVPLLHNDEQMTRARMLAQIKPKVSVIELDEKYPSTLAAVVERELASGIATGGLRNFVRVIEERCPLSGGGD